MKIVLGCSLLFCFGVACGGDAVRPSSVILVTIDTLRADRLSSMGYRRKTTPNLDALAEEGVLFERAYSNAPFTAPAHASLFTSLVTQSHGVETWGRTLDPELPELFGLFRTAGYRTGAFYNHPGLVASNLLHSVDHVELRYFEPAEDTVQSFLDWAQATPRHFLAWVHLWDVHRPYGFRNWQAEHLHDKVDRDSNLLAFAEGPWGTEHDASIGRSEQFYNLNRERLARTKTTTTGERLLVDQDLAYLEDRYDNGVLYADAGIGLLLAGLRQANLLDSTLLVVTSDHGESLRERESCLFTHDPFLTEETLRVPLLMRFPKAQFSKLRIPDLVRSIDVLPSLLEFAGISSPSNLQGRSLLPLTKGQALQPVQLFAQTQTRHAKENIEHADEPTLEFRQALITEQFKLIHDRSIDQYELYDLARDPGEQNNLVQAEGSSELFDRMRALLELARQNYPTRIAEGQSGEDQQELLDAMGYTGGE